MKYILSKKIICVLVLFFIATTAFSFNKGFVLGLRADFYGTMTLPEITEKTLKYMNPKAVDMTGLLSGLLMGGELEVGYIFNFDSAFSGIGIYGYLGVGQGNASQKITAVESNIPFDIFMIVDYLPVVNFGIKGKAMFFDNRFIIGLGIGSKAILDTSPQYLVYSTLPNLIETEIGEIIVTEDMMKNMNPLSLSFQFEMGYVIPVLPTTEVVIGWFTSYNLYSPKYITLPPSLEALAQANRPGGPTSPELDFNQAFPDFFLNSLDFGVNIGLVFKL